MKVLVVDDDKLNLNVAGGYLKMYFPEFETIFCYQPKQVMDILQKENVDILILDIMMPEITGVDLLQIIRSCNDYRDLEIIMLTAKSDMESFETCFELGASDYLTKPIDITEFKARIKASAATRRNALILHEAIEKNKVQNDIMRSVKDLTEPIERLETNVETFENSFFKMNLFISSVMEQLVEFSEDHESSFDFQKIKQIIERYKKEELHQISMNLNDIILSSREEIQTLTNWMKT